MEQRRSQRWRGWWRGRIARPGLAAAGMVLAVAGALPVFGGWRAGADQLVPSPGGVLTGPFRMPAAATTTTEPGTTTTVTPTPTSTSTTAVPSTITVDFAAVAGAGGDADAVPLEGAVFTLAGGPGCTTDATGVCGVPVPGPGAQLCWQETTPPVGWLAAAPGCVTPGSTPGVGITVAATQVPVSAPIEGRVIDAGTEAALVGSTYDLFRIDPPAPEPSGTSGASTTTMPSTTTTTTTTLPAGSGGAGTLVWVARATSGSGGAVVWPPQQIDAVYCAREVAAASGYQLDASQHCLSGPLTAGSGSTIDLPNEPVAAIGTPLTAAPGSATVPPPSVPAPSVPAPSVPAPSLPAPPATPAAAAGVAAPVATATSTPDAASSPGPPVDAVSTVPPPASASPSLPLTGTASRGLARWGTGLIALGIALVLASHRRRPARPTGPPGRRSGAAAP